jgi:hypothetical protein
MGSHSLDATYRRRHPQGYPDREIAMNLKLFRQMLRAAPDFIQEQVNFWISMAEDAIRADEREKINDKHSY